jgi:hypothetical protein
MDREAIEEAIEVLEDASAEMLAETGNENYYAEAIAILRQALSGEAVKHIKTWNERCEEHPDHQERIISERMIQERMQEEIDELRQALIMFQHSTKIFGPGLEELLNSAGFYRKREWVGLHGSEVPDTYKYDVMFMEGWLWAEERLKEKNHG